MRQHTRAVAVWISVLAAGFGSGLSECGRSRARAEEKAAAPVTNDEGRAFARALETAVASGHVEAFDRMIDWDAVLDTATSGLGATDSLRKAFSEGVRKGFREGAGFSGAIVSAVKEGGRYSLLRLQSNRKRPSFLVRFILPAGGLNYHEFLIARRPDGQVKAVDLYIFTTGELISQTLRRSFVPAVAHDARSLIERLTGAEQDYVKHLSKFEAMSRALIGKRPAEALEVYRRLPPSLQKDKNALMIRCQAARTMGDDREYSRAMEDFRAAYPKDASVDFISIDYYLLKKQFSEALACVDRVEKAVGGDPFLQTLRAGISIEKGDLEAARKCLQTAIDQEPTLQVSYEGLINVTLQQHKFAETLKALRLLKERFHVERKDLETDPAFMEFVKTPEYREWRREGTGKRPD